MNATPLKEIVDILDGLGIEHAVIGAHAVNAWVEPRFTFDIDITLLVTGEQYDALKARLVQGGYAPDKRYGGDAASGPDFERFISPKGEHVEMQVAKTAFQEAVVRRAKKTPEGARVATPEDLLVMKAIANRSKDGRDLAELAALPELDWEYVMKNATEWGAHVVREIEEARRRR